MADVKWIKIITNVFDDEKFQIIDSLPEADAIELIWFKLLVFAGKQNNSGLFLFNDSLAYTDEMLASIFHRPINTVRLAMKTFVEMGMIEVIDGVYSIPNWNKYQTLDAYEKKKERDKLYQQKRRNEQKCLLDEKKSSDNRLTVERKCSYSYSNSINSNNNNNNSINNIINYLNNKTNKRFSDKRKDTIKHINARLEEGYTEEDFKKVIDYKVSQWGDDPKMAQYLQPSTLFAPSHFEEYLNACPEEVDTKVDFDYEWGFNQFFDYYPKKYAYDVGLKAYLDYMNGVVDPMVASKELYHAMILYLEDCKKNNPQDPERYVKSIDKWIREDSRGWVRIYLNKKE